MTTQAETFTTADSDTLGPVLSWTEEEGDIDIVSNRARVISISGGTGHPRAYAPALSTDDHLVEIVGRTSADTAEHFGLMVRKSNSAKTYYHIDLNNSEGVRAWSCVAGAFTSLGNVATTISDNTDYTLTALMRDSTLVTYVDGVQKNLITNSAITGNVRGGIVGAVDTQSPPTANLEWDSYDAFDLPVTFVNAGAEGDAGSGNVTLGAPASPASNDVWIAVVHSSDQVSHSFTDWTQIVQGNGGGTTSRISIWYFRYAGVTPNLIVGHTAGAGISGGIASFRGCKTSGSPVNVSSASITGGTDASIEHATVTPTVDGCLLLVCNGSADDNARTTPAGYAVAFTHVGTAGTPDESSSMMYRDVLNGTATGTVTITQGAADAWASYLIALEPASTATAYALDCQPGSFALSGVAATLARGLFLNCQPGSYSVTGILAVLQHAYNLNAQPGSYSVTGVLATLLADRMLNAAPGSFSITGVLATLLADRMLDAQPGSYALTGVLAALNRGFVLDAQPGAIAISGSAATLLADRMLNAAPAAFVVTGFETALLKEFVLDAQPGIFVVTGVAAQLLADRMLNAAPGSYALTGVAAELNRGFSLSADPGAFLVTGQGASLLADRMLNAGIGAFLVTGTAAALLAARMMNAAPGSFLIDGFDAELVLTSAGVFSLDAEPGAIAIGGADATLLADRMLNAGPGSFSLTGYEALLEFAEAGGGTGSGSEWYVIARRRRNG